MMARSIRLLTWNIKENKDRLYSSLPWVLLSIPIIPERLCLRNIITYHLGIICPRKIIISLVYPLVKVIPIHFHALKERFEGKTDECIESNPLEGPGK
jgi:CBS domain containing-hemolysin-like protein